MPRISSSRARVILCFAAAVALPPPSALADPPKAKDDTVAIELPKPETEAQPTEPSKESAPKTTKRRSKPEPTESVRPGRDLEVAARSLRLTKSAKQRLLGIAKRFRAATKKKLVITGGDRDAATQARLMFKKLEGGEDLLVLYARTDLVRPILAAYELARANGKGSDRAVIRAMTKVIRAQVQRGEFVSRHLEFAAADVRSRDLSEAEVEALRAAVREEPGAQLVDERDGAAPHLHLNL